MSIFYCRMIVICNYSLFQTLSLTNGHHFLSHTYMDLISKRIVLSQMCITLQLADLLEHCGSKNREHLQSLAQVSSHASLWKCTHPFARRSWYSSLPRRTWRALKQSRYNTSQKLKSFVTVRYLYLFSQRR